jgi:NADP-dependent 3-hydroxy acid dehydrogenase YdfG
VSFDAFRLDGRVIVVTGSTQGLGAAIARRAADLGAAGIVVTGRNEEHGAAVRDPLGCEAVFVHASLEDEPQVRSIVRAADERFGRLDGLVNAAGLSTRGTLDDTSVELWDRLFAVNVRAPFVLMQEAARVMRRCGGGAVVNIITMASHGGAPELTAYAASKAALATLTRNAGHQLHRDRIRGHRADGDLPAQRRVADGHRLGHRHRPDGRRGGARMRVWLSGASGFVGSNLEAVFVQGAHRARPEAPRAQDHGFGYFVASLVEALRAGRPFTVWESDAINMRATRTLATDAAGLIRRIIVRDATGIFHCCGGESVTRAELACAAARAFELDESLLRFRPPEEPPGAPVPYDTSLDATATAAALGVELPGVAEQLERLREELCVTT